MNKPIVHVYTLCYNEERMLPYFLRHYLSFADKVVIFDNHSTDSSVKIAHQHENVEVKKFETGDQIDDTTFLEIKNNCWKESKGVADFVVVCDMDEFLFHPDMVSFLEKLKREDYSLVKPIGYHMINETWPTTDGQIYEEIKKGLRSTWSDKMILFDPNKLKEINYDPGCHTCSPKGEVKVYQDDEALKMLHYKYLDVDHLIAKNARNAERLSKINKKKGWGFHYNTPEEKQRKSFQEMLEQSQPVI